MTDLKASLQEKTEVIGRLDRKISEQEGHYVKERARASSLHLEEQRVRQQLKDVESNLQQLKLSEDEKKTQVATLMGEKTKLSALVVELDGTINSYAVLESHLKNRLWATEQWAIRKEIEAKQIEADFYNVAALC